MSNESNLPKWAREEIARLRRRVAELEVDNAQIVGEGRPEHSNGFWFTDMDPRNSLAFPAPMRGRFLEFRGSSGRINIRRQQETKTGDEWIQLMGCEADGIIVRPRASNVVLVRASRYGEVQ
jgi:hypothetical protein